MTPARSSRVIIMGLTIKQAKFVGWYLELGSAAEAYRRAYDLADDHQWAGQHAHELLQNPEISAMIERGRAEDAERNIKTRDGMIRYLARAASYDPNEIIQHRRGSCRRCHGDAHEYQWRQHEYFEAVKLAERMKEPLPDYAGGLGYKRNKPPHPDCPSCDGDGIEYVWTADTRTLSDAARAGYCGLKAKKDGIEIIMPDRQKSLEFLGKMLGVDVQNVRISSDLGELAAAIKLEGTDADQAARIYAKLMGAA